VKSSRAFDQYRDSALWRALDEIVSELKATGEVSLNTAPDYVIGYLCAELTARKMVSPGASGARS
jgi:hypothetical protein